MMTQIHFYLLLPPHKPPWELTFCSTAQTAKLRGHLEGSVLVPVLSPSLQPCTAELVRVACLPLAGTEPSPVLTDICYPKNCTACEGILCSLTGNFYFLKTDKCIEHPGLKHWV